MLKNIKELFMIIFLKHNNNKSINNCNIVKFLNSIGCDKAKQFYKKYCEPFILKSIKNCFNYNNFHILYEEIQIITSIKL